MTRKKCVSKKQNGKLNSEKILHYRRTLYTQTVKLLNQISAIDEISMNPEAKKTDEFKSMMDDIFFLR